MFLTRDDFSKIRKIKWIKRELNDIIYNTPATLDETNLFWNDFIQYIFYKKYSQQNIIKRINNFNNHYPVYMTDNYELLLPKELELILEYSNATTPYIYSTPFSRFTILIVAIILFISAIFINFYYPNWVSSTRGFI